MTMRNRPILVIDGDPQSRKLVTTALTEADFEVLSAPEGLTGIELARRVQPAVIILDVMTSATEGMDTLQGLKRDAGLKDVPVVAITGSSDLTCADKAFRAGAQFFLPKPFRAASLLALIELAADRAQQTVPMQRRRRHPRYPAEIAVSCIVDDGAHTPRELTGHTVNVSLSGLSLWLPEQLEKGALLLLKLALPEGPITAKGRVMWQDPKHGRDGRFHHGVRFLGFTEEGALSQYRRHLSQLAEESTD
jgi:DNA-binding response OmpR family regulator